MLKLEHTGSGDIFYATNLSAGFDICANENLVILPHEWQLIKTGLRIVESFSAQKIEIGETSCLVVPEIQVRPRSGLALKHGITVLNSPSTIDADYRGEIMVTLIYHGKKEFIIEKGDRIAQGICALIVQLPGINVKNVERGAGGFGSSGKN